MTDNKKRRSGDFVPPMPGGSRRTHPVNGALPNEIDICGSPSKRARTSLPKKSSIPPPSGSSDLLGVLPDAIYSDMISYLGAGAVPAISCVSSRWKDACLANPLWQEFCMARYKITNDVAWGGDWRGLLLDRNGWFPHNWAGCSTPIAPVTKQRTMDSTTTISTSASASHVTNVPTIDDSSEATNRVASYVPRRIQIRLDQSRRTVNPENVLTMDLRVSGDEVFAVSEAHEHKAYVRVFDVTGKDLHAEILSSTMNINCVDVNDRFFCAGGDDGHVRLYRRDDYTLAYDKLCASEINDLRMTNEDYTLAVRTRSRYPAGLDLIPWERPEESKSILFHQDPALQHWVHAIDLFDTRSMNQVACAGEDTRSGQFSIFVLDLRMDATQRIVHKMPVTRGHPLGTMLWPLRTHGSHSVYANLSNGPHNRMSPAILHYDIRKPDGMAEQFSPGSHVEDFRVHHDNLYVVTEAPNPTAGEVIGPNNQRARPSTISLYRYLDGNSKGEFLTSLEDHHIAMRGSRDDLKTMAMDERGITVSCGRSLIFAHIARATADVAPFFVDQNEAEDIEDEEVEEEISDDEDEDEDDDAEGPPEIIPAAAPQNIPPPPGRTTGLEQVFGQLRRRENNRDLLSLMQDHRRALHSVQTPISTILSQTRGTASSETPATTASSSQAAATTAQRPRPRAIGFGLRDPDVSSFSDADDLDELED